MLRTKASHSSLPKAVALNSPSGRRVGSWSVLLTIKIGRLDQVSQPQLRFGSEVFPISRPTKTTHARDQPRPHTLGHAERGEVPNSSVVDA
jgi:hypothetical protein